MAMLNDLVIENARIMFRNFAGQASTYNRAGDRNFCLVIEDEATVDQLKEDGWNVKSWSPIDGDPIYYIPVSVRYDGPRPPKVYMVTRSGKVLMDETNVGEFDNAEFRNIDIVVHPSVWEVNGKTGVKAYLNTMYATIVEDAFAHKYESYN